MDSAIDFAFYLLIPAIFLVVLVWNYKRANKRLPEELGQPVYADVRELWGLSRTTLYDNFMVITDSFYTSPRLIHYRSITRIGVGRRLVSPKFPIVKLGRSLSPMFALLSIEYKDVRDANRLAQFQCSDGGELLHVLAERLKAAGKSNLVTWPDTHENELDGGVKTD